MRTLQSLLTILDGQKLSPGYLTPPKPTALECAIDLKRQLDAVTINGLPILEGEDSDLLAPWYASHVVGGTGAFLTPAHGIADFARAMRQKFLVEISAAP